MISKQFKDLEIGARFRDFNICQSVAIYTKTSDEYIIDTISACALPNTTSVFGYRSFRSEDYVFELTDEEVVQGRQLEMYYRIGKPMKECMFINDNGELYVKVKALLPNTGVNRND